jgi:ATP-dependent helicase/nuclease subunit B
MEQKEFGIFDGSSPNVFTIEPHFSFLDELALVLKSEILQSSQGDFALSDAIILLPTRRAARALQNAFLSACSENAMILPRIRTLGDIEPEEMNLLELSQTDSLPPVIPDLLRKFTLAKMIMARDSAASWNSNLITALQGADALADLLESAELVSEGEVGFDWSKLDKLVEDKELAAHWEKSKEFLQIVTQFWPQYLESEGFCDPAYKRRRAVELLAQKWESTPPAHPIILAGSTGALPSTKKLMKVVAKLKRGAVVLPGLDSSLPDEVWANVGKEEGHPQRHLHDTINYIGISRHDVKVWPSTITAPNTNLVWRRRILNLALTPKESTSDWREAIDAIMDEDSQAIVKGFDNFQIIEAENEDQEASMIALELRETLEHGGQTCALITPNLDIARRVSKKVARWGIELDISAGLPIAQTQIGSFFNVCADWISNQADPVSIMALLCHPLTTLGMESGSLSKGAAALEISALRGAQKYYDLASLCNQLESFKPKDWHNNYENRAAAIEIVRRLRKIGEEAQAANDDIDISSATSILLNACEAIAQNPSATLWRGQSAQASANFFFELRSRGGGIHVPSLHQGLEVIKSLIASIVVRPTNTHPRLAILGPLEARLLAFDKTILAGLDEGVWPAFTQNDPFLSHRMRSELGLQPNEMRMGLTAHDFAQLSSGPRVIITRSARRAGSPVVPSRWLWRLQTLVRGALPQKEIEQIFKHGGNTKAIAKRLISARSFDPSTAQPKPMPPLEARPHEFYATQIEDWIRDPYKTYVKKILKLRPLDPLGGEVSSKERGSAIHAGMEIVERWKANPPADATAELIKAFEQQLALFGFKGQRLADELRRLDQTAGFMAQYEMKRIDGGWEPKVEQEICCEVDLDGFKLKLSARADRIDFNSNGNIEIWDFKTGTVPSNPQINALYAAQLPVTALILNTNPMAGFANSKVSGFGHIKIGGRAPVVTAWKQNKLSMEELMERLLLALKQLASQYNDPEQAYLSKPLVHILPTNNYADKVDILARRAEWASVIDEVGGE